MQPVSFGEALGVWWRIGFLSFGGPAGQIALMHRIIVEEKRWLDERRFLHALNYCMLLPGPEAQQLATYVGWLLHGVRGGVVAGFLFVLPGAVVILALSWLYVLYSELTPVEGLFTGIKAAVLAIVVQALVRIGRRALRGWLEPVLAATAFLALFVFDVPFPLVVLGAGILGFVAARRFSEPAEDDGTAVADVMRPGTRTAAVVCLLLWFATVGGLHVTLGEGDVFTRIAVFFSTMATVTFGGAYAVLAYVAQQAVESFQWLRPGEMLDGLGLAETTPGPLILVTQFVGFLAAWRDAGSGGSLALATVGALLTTWVTFLPCFLWIFAGAPYVEKLRGHRALSAALSAITAAVVGVIANLALWFAINALFSERIRVTELGMDLLLPAPASIDLPMLAIAAVAFALAFAFRVRILVLLAVCAALGMLWSMT